MDTIIILLIIAVIGAVVAVALQAKGQKRDSSEAGKRSDQDKQQKFEGMLQSGESLLAFCSNDSKSNYYCAVTDKQVILETKDGTVKIPLDRIEKVHYLSPSGNKLKSNAEGAMYFEINAGKKYKVYRYSEKFSEVVRALVKLGFQG